MRLSQKPYSRKNQRAYTLLEIIICVSIMTIVGMAEVSLIILTARSESRGFVTMRVFKHADRIQDQVTLMIQNASREAGVFFTDQDGVYYRTMIFREGVGYPNQKISYDPESNNLMYDPNMNIPGDERAINYDNEKIAILADFKIRTGMKTGGIPDSSVILVNFKVTDYGKGKNTYRDPSQEHNWITSRRSFAVCMRRM